MDHSEGAAFAMRSVPASRSSSEHPRYTRPNRVRAQSGTRPLRDVALNAGLSTISYGPVQVAGRAAAANRCTTSACVPILDSQMRPPYEGGSNLAAHSTRESESGLHRYLRIRRTGRLTLGLLHPRRNHALLATHSPILPPFLEQPSTKSADGACADPVGPTCHWFDTGRCSSQSPTPTFTT